MTCSHSFRGLIYAIALQIFIINFQDALEVDAFSRSEEAQAGEALFDAYRAASEEDVKRCISKRSIFLDLDNQVKGRSYFPLAPAGRLLARLEMSRLTFVECESNWAYQVRYSYLKKLPKDFVSQDYFHISLTYL